MKGVHTLAAYREEAGQNAVLEYRSPAKGRNWESGRRRIHYGDRDIQEVQRGTHGFYCAQSVSCAVEGEDSPVSVIGRIMSSQTDRSHTSSASDLAPPPCATNYAAFLSQQVQQAFRKSDELQQAQGTWPACTTSRREECLNSRGNPHTAASAMASAFPCIRQSFALPACSTAGPAATSEDDRFSICSSSTADRQDRDDVIEFFPVSKDSPTVAVGIAHKDVSVKTRSSSTGNGRSFKVHESRKGGSNRRSRWTKGRHEDGASIHNVDDSADAELARVSASHKWDDAERWLSLPSISADGGDSLQQPRPSANTTLHGWIAGFAPSKGTQLAQARPYQQLCKPKTSAQDEQCPGTGAASHCAGMKEAGAEASKHQWKRDMATQSTPTEWSRCDSPDEETVCLPVPASEQKRSPKAQTTAATGNEVSPARHNTPARSAMVNLAEMPLEAPARDPPLKGSSTCWLQGAEDESISAVDLIGRRSPSHHENSKLTVRVSMLEARIAAWVEVERAKHIAKFKREQAKIEAWDSLQTAVANAELHKLEVKLEKMRFERRERIAGKLRQAQRRAQDMLGIAEAQKGEELARVAARADQLRRGGHFPSTAFHIMCSLTTKIKQNSNLHIV